MEEIEMVLDMAKESMSSAIEHLKKNLGRIRAGRAQFHYVGYGLCGLLWVNDTVVAEFRISTHLMREEPYPFSLGKRQCSNRSKKP